MEKKNRKTIMEKKKKIALFLMLMIFFMSIILFVVFAQVGKPSTFYGAVRIDGNPAPVGTLVSALVNGITTNYYVEQEGLYIISVTGGNNGDTIQFSVNGQSAGTGTYNSEQIQEKDLDVGISNQCIGYPCSWKTKDKLHSDCSSPYEGCVCMDGTSYYNKACCSGNVVGISRIT